ncbi:adenylyl cyclase (ISS) [Achlya hypogyna]|uniref:Phosphodiesterase n=1 Tax=Achlya hypogyna TaxID=1202772 RepID=A0A1V9YWP3_ACHHY|nr:adenylyl cyclase (ISS) [Achlya hypogyna]
MHSGKVTPRNAPRGFGLELVEHELTLAPPAVHRSQPSPTNRDMHGLGSGTFLPTPPTLRSFLSPLTWLRASSSKTLSGRVAPDRLSSRKSMASQHSSALSRWDFDAGLETNHLRQMDQLQTMFGIVGAYAALDVSFDGLSHFMHEIKLGYVETPDLPFHRYYHNFSHAMDVTQTLFAMLHFMQPGDPLLGPVEKAITLIAALGHDIHHPGVTNHYIVVSKHAMALEYGDGNATTVATTSVKVWGVLERMHAAETRRLVAKHGILRKFPHEKQQQLEKLLMNCILNTDMARHDGLLKHVQSLVPTRHRKFDVADTHELCAFLLHCADLSNAAKPWKTAERWASLITQEFFEQGQAEKARGMPVSPNCDAMTTMVPELQIKFINFAVLPCFTVLQALFPHAIEAVNHALANIHAWEAKREAQLTLEQRVIIRAISVETNPTAEWSKMQEQKDLHDTTHHRREYIWAKRLSYHPAYLTLLAITTVYVIFEPDLRVLAVSKAGDNGLNVVLGLVTVVCVVDMVVATLADHTYCRSFYACLDVITVVSLLVEIANYAPGATTNALFAHVLPELLHPRLVRVARILRAVHAVPIWLFQLMVATTRHDKASAIAPSDADEGDDRATAMTFQRKDIARLFLRLANKANDLVSPEAIETLVEEAYNGVGIPPHAARNVLAYFAPTPIGKHSVVDFGHRHVPRFGINRASFAHGIRQMELKYDGAPDLFIDAAPRSTERMVGRELSNIVIKRILILMLLVLLVVPPLLYTAPVPIDMYVYSVQSLHASALATAGSMEPGLAADIALFHTALAPLFLQLYNVSAVAVANVTNGSLPSDDATVWHTFRYDQVEGVQVFGCAGQPIVATRTVRTPLTGECVTSAMFDLREPLAHAASYTALGTFLCFLCVVVSVLYLDYETYTLVIHPIESMLAVVQRLATNPLRSIPCEAGEASNEILLLQNTLAKIASLIQIGFGEAGAEILSGNMLEGDLNPMAEGKKVYAIFGFCSIRGFAEATEKLKEEIMTFTNMIGEVVHRHVHSLNGHANKNIGQAFLLVWKVPTTSIEYSLVAANQTPQHMSPKKNSLLTVMESDNTRQGSRLTIADKALISFLKVQLEMHHSKAFAAYSEVLSPENPMGFGLHVGWAIEGAIGSRYKIDASYLSPDVNMSSRLEGATKQFGVTLLVSHTFHKLLSSPIQAMCRLIDCVTVKGSEKPLSLYTFDIYDLPSHSTNSLGSVPDLQRLQARMPIEFRIAFDKGVAKYLEGNWPEATQLIELALCFEPTDGPSKSLLRVMAEHNKQAPPAWQGYRALTEK